MRNSKANFPLGMGLVIQGVTHVIRRFVDIPAVLHYALMLSAIALILWGVIIIARSPKMKNSRLRHWKLRLIGRDPS